MNVVGVVGLARSGKDTLADWLVANRHFCKVALADPLKRICHDVFGFTEAQLWGNERDVPDLRWNGLTARHALQQLGTEWGRRMHEDVWVRKGLQTAERILVCGDGYTQQRGINPAGWPDDEPVGVVIPDIRFPNEVAAILDAGGRIVRVHRPKHTSSLMGVAGAHESEQYAMTMDIGRGIEVYNDKSLDEFYLALQALF